MQAMPGVPPRLAALEKTAEPRRRLSSPGLAALEKTAESRRKGKVVAPPSFDLLEDRYSNAFFAPRGILEHVTKPITEAGLIAEIKKANGVWKPGKNGEIALHRALVKRASSEVVKALLQVGRDSAAMKDGSGLLPLHLALQCQLGEAIVLDLIAAYPAAASVPEIHDAKLPLHLALENGAADGVIAELLNIDGTAAFSKTRRGYLPMHIAAANDTSEFVLGVLFLANNEATMVKADDGCLPLHAAAKSGAPECVVSCLLDFDSRAARFAEDAHGAEQDARGYLPLHWAVAKDASERVITMLIDAFPDGCQTADRIGNLPLHVAVENQADVELVGLLVSRCPRATGQRNDLGQRPYDVALQSVQASNLDAVLRLLEHSGEPGLLWILEDVQRNVESTAFWASLQAETLCMPSCMPMMPSCVHVRR